MMLAFLVSPLGKIAGYALIALILAGTLVGIKHEWDLGQAARVQVHAIVHNSSVQTKAVTKADAVVAKSDELAQVKIVTRTRTLLQKVPVYVTTSTPCIPWSVLRLHDAAVLGVDPSALPLPAGQSPNACSDVSTSAFVDTIIANYRAAQQNAQQLDDLIADANAREKAVAPASVVATP